MQAQALFMSHSRKKVNAKPLDTKAMRVAGDDIYVGGVRFKRTVLPSATAPSPQPIEAEADQLFDEWEAE